MCDLNIQNIRVVKAMLRLLEICSRLSINFFKRKIGAIGVDRNVLDMFLEILNCSIMNIPFIFLGLPIGGTSSESSFWDPMITKVMKSLSIWKGKNLFFVVQSSILYMLKDYNASVQILMGLGF